MAQELKDARLQLLFTPSLVQRVDEWRRNQQEIPSRSEAIRRLVEKALDSEPPRKRGT